MYTGLRPGELRKTEFEDLDTKNWTLRVRHPKGEASYGEYRIVPIHELLKLYIQRYLNAREKMLAEKGLLEAKPLVCKKQWPHKFYSDNILRQHKRKIEEISGVNFELRALRRTYGQMLIDRGVSIESVSIALGHTSTITTEKYYCRKNADTVRSEVLHAFDPAVPSPKSPLISRKIDFTGYS